MNEKQIRQEKSEAELLTENGFKFKAGKREFTIKPLTLGTILHCNKYAVQMKFNLMTDKGDSLYEELNNNIQPILAFISCAILGSNIKIRLFRKMLENHLKKHLKPKDVLAIAVAILQMYDLTNFITSIRLLTAETITTPRTSKEPLIDG